MSFPRNKSMPKRNDFKAAVERARDKDGPNNGPRPPGGRPPKNDNPPQPNNPGGGRKNKDKNRRRGPHYIGGVGPYQGVRQSYVDRLVNGLLRDEIRGLRHDRNAVQRDTDYLSGMANTQYQRGLGDLEYVHGEVKDFLTQQAQKNAAMYQQQGAAQQAATQALQGQIDTTYGGAQQNVIDELQRLGIQGGGNTTQLLSDQANAQAMAAQSGANATSTMNLAAGNADQLSGLIQGMNTGSHLANLGANLNKRNDALAGIQKGHIDQMTDISDAISDARAGRKDVYMQLMQQLQQTGYGQWLDLQQLRMQRRQLNHQLNKGKKSKGKDKKKRNRPADHGGL